MEAKNISPTACPFLYIANRYIKTNYTFCTLHIKMGYFQSKARGEVTEIKKDLYKAFTYIWTNRLSLSLSLSLSHYSIFSETLDIYRSNVNTGLQRRCVVAKEQLSFVYSQSGFVCVHCTLLKVRLYTVSDLIKISKYTYSETRTNRP